MTNAHPAAANESFVVTTSVSEAGNNEPIAKHRIVFDGGVAYDFDEQDDAVLTVFDTNRNRIVLLNRTAKVRCFVNTDDLTKMAAVLQLNADTPAKKERLGMSANVQVDESQAYSIRFGNAQDGSMQYTSTTQTPPVKTAAFQFGQFANWASRLNMAQRLSLPPFARIKLNERIAAAGQMPDQLELEINRHGQTSRYKSKHILDNKLTDEDRKRINEASGMIALFTDTPLKDFPN
ncbi:MAG: hypothetical protein WBD20_24065 [Pirellulaceae bacterium]